MEKNDFDRIVVLFSFKEETTERKGYDIIVVNNDGYLCEDGQELANRICAFGKALAALKGYTTYFALDFRYCNRKDIAQNIAEIHNSIRMNEGVCNIYDGFYSSDDLSCFSSSDI